VFAQCSQVHAHILLNVLQRERVLESADEPDFRRSRIADSIASASSNACSASECCVEPFR
jgi:hypothetical protein